MNAVKLLKEDHREVAALMKKFEEAEEGEKSPIAQRICTLLTVHAQIEEELLYPAAQRTLREKQQHLVDEAAVEHSSVKTLISQIESSHEGEELYDARVKVLGEYVKHHVKEEENELFPKLQQMKIDLGRLGERLAARKAELLSEMGEPVEMEESAEDENLARRHRSRSGNRGEHRPAARARRAKSR